MFFFAVAPNALSPQRQAYTKADPDEKREGRYFVYIRHDSHVGLSPLVRRKTGSKQTFFNKVTFYFLLFYYLFLFSFVFVFLFILLVTLSEYTSKILIIKCHQPNCNINLFSHLEANMHQRFLSLQNAISQFMIEILKINI